MKSQHQLTANDLFNAVRNAQHEGVNSLVIQCNGINYPVINAQIIPQRNHSDLVLFVGASAIVESPKPSFLSGLFSKKLKPVPLNKQLHIAFLDALETVLVSNGKNPNSFDFSTFQEIKSSIAQFSEALESYSNSKELGGAL